MTRRSRVRSIVDTDLPRTVQIAAPSALFNLEESDLSATHYILFAIVCSWTLPLCLRLYAENRLPFSILNSTQSLLVEDSGSCTPLPTITRISQTGFKVSIRCWLIVQVAEFQAHMWISLLCHVPSEKGDVKFEIDVQYEYKSMYSIRHDGGILGTFKRISTMVG